MQSANEHKVQMVRTYQLIARAARVLALSALASNDYQSARDYSESARDYSERAAGLIREILG